MKKLLFSLFFMLTFSAVMAQAPQRISYQSVIRDANKVVVASSPVGIKISLLQGTATGPAVYVETHSSTTNANGLVSLEIGTGTAVSGTFAGIDWSNGSYLIQTETDPTGGTNYSIPGIAALNSVPYALNAANATKLQRAVTINGVAFDGSSNVTIPATGAVPYTGATQAVDLGGYDLKVNGVTVGRGKGNEESNTATGNEALARNTTGFGNTASGNGALAYTTTGYLNTASGNAALYQNTTGSYNMASGFGALISNTKGSDNTASGPLALISNTTGDANSAIGANALSANTTGSKNTAIGNEANVGSGALTNATAIGASAIVDASNTIQLGNTDVTKVITSGTLTAGTVTYPRAHGAANQVLTTSGTGTLTWATPSGGVPYTGANQGVDLGAYDLKVNGLTVGRGSGNISTNTASGNSALVSNTTGSENTAIGNQADVGSGALTNAAAIGAGAKVNASNTIQLGNTDVTKVITSGTLTAGTVTYPSVHGAANQVLTTSGTGTLTWATPSGGVPYTGATQGVDLGAYDLKVNGLTVGRGKGNEESNTATGNEALASNTTGSFNTASGQAALNTNTTGNFNTATGNEALVSNTTGSFNTASGQSALNVNTTGSNNTASGNYALSENTTGSNNTAIGNEANVGSGTLTNATAIGAGAIVSASNTIQLGNTSVTKVITSGTLTAGTVTYPNVHNTIAGQVLTTNASGVASWTTPATGLPSSGNTAGDMLFWDGTAWVKVSAGSNGQNLTFYNGVPIWVGVLSYSYAGATAYANTVLNPKTGKIWMDRNLGATQVATSSTDAASYGDLFQWGRRTDGHQIRTSLTTPTQSSLDQPANINFILAPDSPYDWRSGQNANLWQGVSGTNNPCPSGYRLPTDLELAAELASWSSSDRAGAFASPLKLPMAGRRFYFGSLYPENTTGFYWSSTVSGTSSLALTFSFDTMSTPISPNGRANGGSVRCIKN
jgi:NDP-sugar pyrophosphorylase family protein